MAADTLGEGQPGLVDSAGILEHLLGGVIFRGASFAVRTNEALSHDTIERARQKIRLEAHVQKSCHRTGSIVRVQGGKDEVTRQRRLHSDSRRLFVANLAHHDDVGVLAKNASQGAPERQTHSLVDLDLVDEVELILHRIFDRDNIKLRAAKKIERGVERRRLAASSRTRDQTKTMRLFQNLLEIRHRGRL